MCSYPNARVPVSTPILTCWLRLNGATLREDKREQKESVDLSFTCIVRRVIHLEFVYMSSSEFLLCLRRFIAQRSSPCKIISDIAVQFRAFSTVMDRIWNKIQQRRKVMSYVSNAGIKWRFNVHLAPLMEGFYKRLTFGIKLLRIVKLQTLLKETESALNSRPLVYEGDDINSNICITMAHFLLMNPKLGIPEIETSEVNDY